MSPKSPFTWLIALIFITRVFGSERREKCYNETVRLQCQAGSALVIRNAFYATSEFYDLHQITDAKNCQNSSLDSINQPCNVNFRLFFNSKCSGKQYCRFRFDPITELMDCSKDGTVFADYECVLKSSMKRFCGRTLTEREGYINSPGYPNYYPPITCNWTIKAEPQQKIHLEVLDLSMKSVKKSPNDSSAPQTYEQACEHYFRVMDSKRRAMHVCGESLEKLMPISINSENVTISLYSDYYWTARGFLLHFKVIGCPRLEAPENGYIVRQDTKTATIMCCLDYVFEDTLDNNKELACVDQYDWDDTNLTCVAIDKIIEARNLTKGSLDEFRNRTLECEGDNCLEDNKSLIYDVIIPSTIIVGLILINAVIVVWLLYKRRKLKYMHDDEESLHESHMNQHHIREPSTSITSATTSHG